MFKTTRWKAEKNKIRVVFKLQFQATQVPLPGSSEGVVVSLVPQDVGRATARSEMAAVVDGACVWSKPVYETAKMVRDPKSGKMIEKMYQFLISVAGSSKNGVLGEATVNLADYVEVFKASSVSFHLKAGAILHVTIQRMQGDVANREAEENGDGWGRQRQRTLQSQLSKYDNEKGLKALIGRNDLSLVKDTSQFNREPRVLPSTRNPPSSHADSKAKLHESHSSGTISPSSSGSSSEIYTPKENTTSNGSTQNDSEGYIEKLTGEIVFLSRKIEASELELQSLRKQIAKESRQAQDLSRERDALLRELEQLKLSQKMANVDDNASADSALEEIKQELDHERNLNLSLRLQLQKTQEANSELLLAVRDLDDLLMEEKRRDVFCSQCSKQHLKDREDRDSIENEREELMIQIEQLAFELEILRREDEDKCSEHLAIISGLEAHTALLEAKLQAQAMSFESDAHNIIQEKVEQEKKTTRIEETLSQTKWNIASTCDRLHEEISRLSSQASSVFFANERIVKKALKEASELRSQKVHLEELLRKTEEDMGALKRQYSMNLQNLLKLFVSKSNEADKLLLKLKEKNEELENYKNSEEELQLLKVEIEKLILAKPGKEIEMMMGKMEVLKMQNEAAEAELRDMQERYSEISVKFAEVEGERQQLMITIRNLKNALKN